MQFTVLVTMYLGYASFMLCRNTLIASSAAMVADPALGIDKAAFGQLMSWHSAGAIAGKLVTGVAADLIGGRRMFLWALSLTAVANLGFAASSSTLAMGVWNFLGQFFKAGGWPAMTKLVAAWYRPNTHGRVWSILSTSSRVGTIGAGLLLGMLLSWTSWRVVFVFSAVVTYAVVAIAVFTLKERAPANEGTGAVREGAKEDEDAPHPADALRLSEACSFFARSRRFWLIGFGIFFLTILMDFINFIPIYLAETLAIDSSRASMASAAFPTGMFTALIGTGLFYDRVSKRQLVFALGGLLALSCLAVVVLWCLPHLPIATPIRVYAAVAVIFVMGLAISPAYYIPMSVFAISFGGRHAGFLVATIDIFGYSGALLFNFFGGSVAQAYGWPVFLSGLLTVAVCATASMTAFLVFDARSATTDSV